MPKPKKQGRLDRTVNNVSFLTNDKGVSYQVSSMAASIWNQCYGHTETASLVAKMVKTMNLKKNERVAAKSSINQIITKLNDISLIRID